MGIAVLSPPCFAWRKVGARNALVYFNSIAGLVPYREVAVLPNRPLMVERRNQHPGILIGLLRIQHQPEQHISQRDYLRDARFQPRLHERVTAGLQPHRTDFPVDASNPIAQTLPNYTINGQSITGLGIATNLPQGRIANNHTIQDTVTYTVGTHSFRVGTDLLDQRSRQSPPSCNVALSLTTRTTRTPLSPILWTISAAPAAPCNATLAALLTIRSCFGSSILP